MDYSKIGEIRELSSLADVDGYLNKGWVLLGVSPGQSADGRDQVAYFLYSVGLPSRESLR